MEIGSMGAMQSGMGMRPMRPPQGDPQQHAEEMSAKLIEKQDADGDGLLSADEFSIDSEKFANLDEDGDGLLNQSELTTGAQAKMQEMKARMEAGGFSSEDMEMMQQMRRNGGPRGSSAQASHAYSSMQELTANSSQYGASYSTDQILLDSLSLSV